MGAVERFNDRIRPLCSNAAEVALAWKAFAVGRCDLVCTLTQKLQEDIEDDDVVDAVMDLLEADVDSLPQTIVGDS